MAKGLPRTIAQAPSKVATRAMTPLTGTIGTTGDAIVTAGGAFNGPTLDANFRRLQDKINALIAAQKL